MRFCAVLLVLAVAKKDKFQEHAEAEFGKATDETKDKIKDRDYERGRALECLLCGAMTLPMKMSYDSLLNRLKREFSSAGQIVAKMDMVLKKAFDEGNAMRMCKKTLIDKVILLLDEESREKPEIKDAETACESMFDKMVERVEDASGLVTGNEWWGNFCIEEGFCFQPRPRKDRMMKIAWEDHKNSTIWTTKSVEELDELMQLSKESYGKMQQNFQMGMVQGWANFSFTNHSGTLLGKGHTASSEALEAGIRGLFGIEEDKMFKMQTVVPFQYFHLPGFDEPHDDHPDRGLMVVFLALMDSFEERQAMEMKVMRMAEEETDDGGETPEERLKKFNEAFDGSFKKSHADKWEKENFGEGVVLRKIVAGGVGRPATLDKKSKIRMEKQLDELELLQLGQEL